MQKTILLVFANPPGTPQLRLDKEYRQIVQALQLAKYRDQYLVEQIWAARPQDFVAAMRKHKPAFVHFAGHGAGEPGIYFEDDAGKPYLVEGEALVELFKQFRKTECVLLNACYSKEQASAIAQHVRYVIGTDFALGDENAIHFAVEFYGTLADGWAIEQAFELARAALALYRVLASEVPELIVMGTSADRPLGAGSSLPMSAPLTLRQTMPIPPDQSGPRPARPAGPPHPTPASDRKAESERLQETYCPVDEAVYEDLSNWLNRRAWREADLETYRVMMAIAGRLQYMRLRPADIDVFPQAALRRIDGLWTKASDTQFGFRAQVQIWRSLGTPSASSAAAHLRKFGERVGWRSGDNWLMHSQLTFAPNAPVGHLPSLKWPELEAGAGGWTAWRDQYLAFVRYADACL